MFPYRLRPPSYGNKLRNEKQEEAAKSGDKSIPLSGGGPVQVAIELDLLELRKDFLRELQKQQQQQSCQHAKKGQTFFRVFRSVFADAKVALLHTKFAPPRCDRGHYSQLIYAACFSLIQKAFFQEQPKLHAAFGLFCLFALYETNPLPQKLQSKMEALAMGLQDSVNPKLRFRRSFKSPIRIDRFHYMLLLKLREEVLAVQAECQNQQNEMALQELEQKPITTTQEQSSEESSSWSCHCGMAADTIEILGRIFPNLDLCEYTGPGCLEGLAGHADYPYPCMKPDKGQLQAWRMTQQKLLPKEPVTDEIIDMVGREENPAGLPESMGANLKSYRFTLQTIRIPPNLSNQKVKALKEALNPILQPSEPTLESLLSKILEGETTKSPAGRDGGAARRKQRRVTWGALDEEDPETTTTLNHRKHPASKPNVVKQDLTYELVLPEELPDALHDGILRAMQSMLKRDQPIFLPRSNKAEAEQNHQHDIGISDEVSSIGIGGVSMAQSSATGHGGAALKSLLAKASNRPLSSLHQPLERPKQQSQINFLTMDDDDDEVSANRDEGNESDTSNLSDSDIEEDVLSVATSAMGQRALTTLLSAVSEKKGNDAPRKKQKKANGASGRRGQRQSPRAQRKKTGKTQNGTEVEDASQADNGNLVSGKGKTALADLLTMAQQTGQKAQSQMGFPAGDMEHANEEASNAETDSLVSGQGKAALANLLSEASSTKRTSTRQKNKASLLYMQEMDEDSLVSGQGTGSLVSDQGKAALANLLNKAQSTKGMSTRQKNKASLTYMQERDEESLVSGQGTDSLVSGQGKAALANLLNEAQSTRGRSSSQRCKAMSRKAMQKVEKEDSQVETDCLLSGQGKAALANLLNEAQSTKERPPRERRAAQANGDAPPQETDSLVSGSARAALANLLNEAQSSTELKQQPKGSQKRMAAKSWHAEGQQSAGDRLVGVQDAPDDASQASSLVSGQGKAALANLLTMAGSSKTKSSPKTSSRKRSKPAPRRGEARSEENCQLKDPVAQLHDEGDSAAEQSHAASSVGQGRAAIEALLTQAGMVGDTSPEAEDASVHTALSGQGNLALNALLSQVHDGSEGMPPPKRRKRVKSR